MFKRSLAGLMVCALLASYAYAQDSEIVVDAAVKEATVFFAGAQLTRSATVDIPAGRSTLVFKGLDPSLDQQSIQVSMGSEVTILSVAKEFNYLAKLVENDEQKRLKRLRQEKLDSLKIEEVKQAVYKDEQEILLTNMKGNGGEGRLTPGELESSTAFLRKRLLEIRMDVLASERSSSRLKATIEDLNKQIKALVDPQGNKRRAEVVVAINAANNSKQKVELKYVTPSANWQALYDIRVEDIDNPLALHFKANVSQQTGSDWDNVNLTLSTAKPYRSTQAPDLRPWRIGYFEEQIMNLSVSRRSGGRAVQAGPVSNPESIRGRVMDMASGQGLPGANVICVGTSIGITTDSEGYYEFTTSGNCPRVQASFVGFSPLTVPVRSDKIDFLLEVGVELDEVVALSDAFEKSNAGFSGPEVERVGNETSTEFQIAVPYNVESGRVPALVEISRDQVSSQYRYYAAPAKKRVAFLIARIADWGTLNLQQGKANLFFQNTYIGATHINRQYTRDTMRVSLGQDDDIVVTRERSDKYSASRKLGSKKTDWFGWEIGLRNTKSKVITILVEEQIPLSTDKSISVELLEASGGEYNEKTGVISWLKILEPTQEVTLNFAYEVKYSKGRRVRY